MSVLVTLRLPGDGKKVEEYAASEGSVFATTRDRGISPGCISHRFYATDGEVMVVDEWPDEASFQAFMAASPEIPEVMVAVGATPPPTVTFYRKLETGDDI